MVQSASPLDGDLQVDFLAKAMLQLAREVRSKRLSGRFSIEFSATAGDIRAPREDRSKPLDMPHKR